MFYENLQPINTAGFPPEDFRIIKSKQPIYNLGEAIEQDDAFRSQLESAKTQENFLKIVAEKGYEFTLSDLEEAISYSLENTISDNDEFDDYELSEEDLEIVAGGTAKVRAASRNSYWHSTGVIVEDQCFYSNVQSLEKRALIVKALQYMEKWEWKGNGEILVTDTDGNNDGRTSYTLTGFINDGSLVGGSIDVSNSSIWQTFF